MCVCVYACSGYSLTIVEEKTNDDDDDDDDDPTWKMRRQMNVSVRVFVRSE